MKNAVTLERTQKVFIQITYRIESRCGCVLLTNIKLLTYSRTESALDAIQFAGVLANSVFMNRFYYFTLFFLFLNIGIGFSGLFMYKQIEMMLTNAL